jgi:hypothetical protein
MRTPTRRREDNIKIDLKERGYEDVGCIDLAQDRANIKTTLTSEARLETDTD